MTVRRVANPFVPGRGHIPPYLAGREVEQGKLLDLLAYLQAGEGAPRDAEDLWQPGIPSLMDHVAAHALRFSRPGK